MNAFTRPCLTILLAGLAVLAQAQTTPASGATSTATARPAGTTPPNTAPYSPAQAEKPDTSRQLSASKRAAAKRERNDAIKACDTEQSKQAKRDCRNRARDAYNRAITP